MTHLLGGKNYVESLCKDVLQLQDIILSLVETTGKIKFTSWKYPSENACELDVDALIERYCYTESDQAANQLGHIVLLELVIDRFCLLLQVVSCYLDTSITLVSSSRCSRPPSRTVTSTMSVGLVSRLFKQKVSDVEESYGKIEKERDELNRELMKSALGIQTKSSRKENKVPFCENETKETTCSETQTISTTYSACQLCSEMKQSMFTLGMSIVEICEAQGLPSSLSKHRRADTQTVDIPDVKKWTTEQTRDIQKVRKLLTSSQIEQETMNKRTVMFEKKISDLQSEINKHAQKKTELEKRLELLNEKVQTLDQELAEKNAELSQKTSEISGLAKKIEDLQASQKESASITEGKTVKIEELEKQLNTLQKEISSYQFRSEKYSELERRLEAKTVELNELNGKKEESFKNIKSEMKEQKQLNAKTMEKLNSVTSELNKLKSEHKMVLQHDKSIQEKQQKLLTRMEGLEDSLDKTQNELNDAQQMCQEFEKEKEETKQHILKAQQKIENFENNNEKACSNDDLLEKLRLLVCYPVVREDYHNAGKRYNDVLSQFQASPDDLSDTDIVVDLQNQVSANEIRSDILKEQITSLKKTLVKLKRVNSAERSLSRSNAHEETFEFREPTPPSEPRVSARSTRRSSLDISSRLANLERLKNKNKPQQSKHTKEEEAPKQSQICPDCDKSYFSKQDLDIHRSFCYGRL